MICRSGHPLASIEALYQQKSAERSSEMFFSEKSLDNIYSYKHIMVKQRPLPMTLGLAPKCVFMNRLHSPIVQW